MSDTINQQREEGNLENENQNNQEEEEKKSINSQRIKNSRNNSRYSQTEE